MPTAETLRGSLVLLAIGGVGCGGTAARPPATGPAAAADSAAVGKPARAASPAALRDITFDDIKLEMQKGEPFSLDRLTPRVRELERHRVRIRGYILPSFQQSGLTQFVLVRDNQECCFGPGAALHDCVVVRMQTGMTAEFSIRPVAVEGTFRVAELRGPDGRHLAIYALDGERVE
ncbi:MAG: DUF3299 domain-containing protein [Planctomycetaceae bacterium]